MGYSLGFDLGTTFTAAAVVRDTAPGSSVEMVSLGNHAVAIPSVVFLREDGELLVGEAADRRSGREPTRAARAFKRRFGDSAPIILDRTPYSADRLSMAVLTSVLADITRREGAPPSAVAVTHPANWGGYKLDLLRQALTAAGAGDAVLVPEPVAAAVQYAATTRVAVGDVVAVYDLGGGTFDAAVLQKTADGFAVLGSPQGIERLGGIDLDEAVLAHVRTALGGGMTAGDLDDPATREALAALREQCVAAKETLSADSEATIPVSLPHLRTSVRLTRSEFEDMVRPMIRDTVTAMRRAVESAKVPLESITAVLLAGGSSRIPLVAELLQHELHRPVVSDSHPKHTVAMGAARVAAATLAPPAAATPAAPPPPPSPSPSAPRPTPPAPPAAPPGGAAPASAGSRSKALVYGGAAAVAAILTAVVLLVTGGGDDEKATDTTSAGVTTVAPDATGDGGTTATTVAAAGPTWSPSTMASIAGEFDAQLPGEPTAFVAIVFFEFYATAIVPSSTPGQYETYTLTNGTLTGPVAADEAAGTATFVASDIDWTSVAAQIVAAPGIVGHTDATVQVVGARYFDGENLNVSISLAAGDLRPVVVLDAQGTVVSTS